MLREGGRAGAKASQEEKRLPGFPQHRTWVWQSHFCRDEQAGDCPPLPAAVCCLPAVTIFALYNVYHSKPLRSTIPPGM